MQDRFKFRAIIKGYYYIDTPKENKEFEPLIFLENVDLLDIGEIGISEEDLEIAIRKQYSNLEDIYIERMLENFRDNSNGIDTYITVTPKIVQQSTGLKDKNGKLIYEGDIFKTQEFCRGKEYYCYSVIKYSDGGYYLEGSYVTSGNTLKFINYDIRNISEDLLESGLFDLVGNIYGNPELLEVNDGY